MNEISQLMERAKEYAQQTKKWIVLPLHSSLSIDEQDKVRCKHVWCMVMVCGDGVCVVMVCVVMVCVW